MKCKLMQAVLIATSVALLTQGIGCARLTTEKVAGVYDLQSVVVHYGERWEIEEHTTYDELVVIVGGYLHHIRGAQLHLRPSGTFAIPHGEPGYWGTWTIESDRVVGYEESVDFMMETVVTRYEVEWNDGVMRIPSNSPDFPVDYVFVKRQDDEASPGPAQSD